MAATISLVSTRRRAGFPRPSPPPTAVARAASPAAADAAAETRSRTPTTPVVRPKSARPTGPTLRILLRADSHVDLIDRAVLDNDLPPEKILRPAAISRPLPDFSTFLNASRRGPYLLSIRTEAEGRSSFGFRGNALQESAFGNQLQCTIVSIRGLQQVHCAKYNSEDQVPLLLLDHAYVSVRLVS